MMMEALETELPEGLFAMNMMTKSMILLLKNVSSARLAMKSMNYETNSEDVHHSFEEHGEIKTFFDLIVTRGMVFITYYDLRAAKRARECLQGSEINDQKQGGGGGGGNERDKNQQYQGCLIVTLKDSRQPIDDNEVQQKFQQFGDIKLVTSMSNHMEYMAVFVTFPNI
ncbi:hypothetical protein BU15DRAFT_67186 [Melanogaster broomeanus]|nr:hypothetical protein BU15DRAFT_67186 [Melanogaster broomeanus]